PDHETSLGVTFPVVAESRLYIRDNERLHCYDVSGKGPGSAPPAVKKITLNLTENELRPDQPTARPARTGKDRAPHAVFVPTPHDIVEKMLELAAVKKDSLLVDLGSGDGRVLIAAARKYGCRAVGYEIDKGLVEISRQSIANSNLE